MFEKTHLLFLYAVSPVHMGRGKPSASSTTPSSASVTPTTP